MDKLIFKLNNYIIYDIIAQIAQIAQRFLGNTIPKIMSRSRRYCVTVNNYDDEKDIAQITSTFPKCIIGAEVAPTTGTKHLQIYLELVNGKTLTALKKDLPDGAHIEKAKGNREQNREYCSKEQLVYDYWGVPDPLEKFELYPWQSELLAKLAEEPDDRTITWYVDNKGNSGKTTIAKHLCLKRKDVIYCSGKAADVKHAIACMDEYPRIILFDLVRSVEGFVSYDALESVKNGIFFSGKYEGKMVIGKCPHLIVFSNFRPDVTKLSTDRWNIIEL